MLKTGTRQGEYTKMPAWLIEQSTRPRCEACNGTYGNIRDFMRLKQVIDHIFPVRFLLSLKLKPHLSINTVSLCQSCHARKLVHETRIFAGDVLGFISGLNSIGYPALRVEEAAAHYGFRLPDMKV